MASGGQMKATRSIGSLIKRLAPHREISKRSTKELVKPRLLIERCY